MSIGRYAPILSALSVAFLLGAAAPESPVADAAMRSDGETVRALVKQGADVNAAQGDGMTALHWAAQNGDLAIVEVLLYAGANPGAATRVGAFTPLHLASRAGNAGAIRALVGAGADVQAVTSSGGNVTPLLFAVSSGAPEAVTALIEHGADVNARETAWEQTPLMWAAAYDHVEALKVLLAAGADASAASRVDDIPEREKERAEKAKIRNRRMAAISQLDRQGDKPEDESAERRDREAEERPAAEQSADEPKPLSYDELIGKKGGLTPLLFAARQGNPESVRALLEAGVDVNQPSGDHTSPMLMAAINGHFDLAKLLLERGADPNLASDAGTTPLFAAINTQWAPRVSFPQPVSFKQQDTDYLELMELLLKAGADPNARLEKHIWYFEYNSARLGIDMWGATPFWRAAFGTDIDAMRLLVRYGADPQIPTKKPPERRRFGVRTEKPNEDPSGLPPVLAGGPGVYPIHAAAGIGHTSLGAQSHHHAPDAWMRVVKYLVEELGADVDVRDHNGYNAIHHAASRGDTALIRYLVEKGGDVTAVSRRGETTADIANGPAERIPPYPAAIALLRSLGSKFNDRCISC